MMSRSQQILTLGRERGWRIAVAESCTGGLLAGALTEIAGSSDVFECGYVTYSNTAKMRLLRVQQDTLASYGAVSEETALEMAKGALIDAGIDVAVSITGIAGPGASEHKPEGRVCFGVATKSSATTETVEFGAIGRSRVRNASVEHALLVLLRALTPQS